MAARSKAWKLFHRFNARQAPRQRLGRIRIKPKCQGFLDALPKPLLQPLLQPLLTPLLQCSLAQRLK